MKPKPFVLCFEAHRKDGRVWAVRQGRGWRLTRAVDVLVPTNTVYRGPQARQPRAYLEGIGVVRGNQDAMTIEAA
jgi:hypothetical protein